MADPPGWKPAPTELPEVSRHLANRGDGTSNRRQGPATPDDNAENKYTTLKSWPSGPVSRRLGVA